MEAYPKLLIDTAIEKARARIEKLVPELDTTVYDVYVKTIDKTVKLPRDASGNFTDEVKEETLLQAFRGVVKPNEEYNTPGGFRLQCSIQTPVSEYTTLNGQKKQYSERSTTAAYNVFDSGIWKPSYERFLGAITNKELRFIGNGLYEITTQGEAGRALNVPLPEFYTVIDGKRQEGYRKMPDGKRSANKTWRTATFRPMFFLQAELDAIESRLEKEIVSSWFVNVEGITSNVDNQDNDDTNARTDDQSTEKTIEKTAEEPVKATGTE